MIKKTIKISLKSLILTFLLLLITNIFSINTYSQIAYAEATNDKYIPAITIKSDYLPGPTSEQLKDKDARQILTKSVLPLFAIRFISITGGLALLFMVIGGLRYITAYGREDETENAKNQVMYALIGFLIAIFAYAIVTIVANIQFKNTSTQQTSIENGILIGSKI